MEEEGRLTVGFSVSNLASGGIACCYYDYYYGILSALPRAPAEPSTATLVGVGELSECIEPRFNIDMVQ